MAEIENCLKGVWRLPMTDQDAYGPYFEMTHHVGWLTLTSNINNAADKWHEASDAFFDSLTGSPGSVLSTVWSGVVLMRWYDMSNPSAGATWMDPLGTYTRSTSTTNLPPEVALVCTQWCEPHDDITRRQSLQNRFFLGPWPSNVLTAGGRPTNGVCERVVEAYDAYRGVFDAGPIPEEFPAVASPTNGSYGQIQDHWVDNDFDIQRRRSLRPASYFGVRP